MGIIKNGTPTYGKTKMYKNSKIKSINQISTSQIKFPIILQLSLKLTHNFTLRITLKPELILRHTLKLSLKFPFKSTIKPIFKLTLKLALKLSGSVTVRRRKVACVSGIPSLKITKVTKPP